MTGWSGSPFLQSLGWAILNSFWQMGLLWTVVSLIFVLLKLNASRKYLASLIGLMAGSFWFAVTFLTHLSNGINNDPLFWNALPLSKNAVQTCLLTASATYLALLIVPVVRFMQGLWFVKRIRRIELSKPWITHKLFVQKTALQLEIKKVQLFLSASVSSPITIGYLKPFIILPFSIATYLSPSQIEAILLHELSHIRRKDYLVNMIVSVIYTVLYFNPFARLFVGGLEAQREICCDEQVLQFGYDRIEYASALVQLQQSTIKNISLAICATGQKNLLPRIEKIVGMKPKSTLRWKQALPVMAALLCILAFNSVLFVTDKKSSTALAYTSSAVIHPWQLSPAGSTPNTGELQHENALQSKSSPLLPDNVTVSIYNIAAAPAPAEEPTVENLFEQVVKDDIDAGLSPEQKQEVSTSVATTKKIASTLQWNEIDAAMGEILKPEEKALAKMEYLREIENVNWQNIEKNIKAQYEKLDWQAINQNISQAMKLMEADSIQRIYQTALKEIESLQKDLRRKAKLSRSALPDHSIQQVQAAHDVLRHTLDSLRAKPKKTVRL